MLTRLTTIFESDLISNSIWVNAAKNNLFWAGSFSWLLAIVIATLTASVPQSARADGASVPLVQSISFSQPLDPNLTLNTGVTIIKDDSGQPVLHFDGAAQSTAVYANTANIDKLSSAVSITCRFKLDTLPPKGQWAALFSKRIDGKTAPFGLGITDRGGVIVQGNDGLSWSLNFRTGPLVTVGAWTNVTLTFQQMGMEVLYINGQSVASIPAQGGMAPNSDPLVLGYDVSGKAWFNGSIAYLRFYPVAFSSDQVVTEQTNSLATRPALAADFPALQQFTRLVLARWDDPRPWTPGYGLTRYPVVKMAGDDPVDWPEIDLDGTPVFVVGSTDQTELLLRDSPLNKPLFRQPYDQVIEPGGHWLRALKWRMGQQVVYTSDSCARSWSGQYELWAFPLIVHPADDQSVLSSVQLLYGGKTIYNLDRQVHSLTLMLPADMFGDTYTLRVNGIDSGPFRVGLAPVKVGDPNDTALSVNFTLYGPQGKYVVSTAQSALPVHTEASQYLAALQTAPVQVPPSAVPSSNSFTRHLGVDVPLSPIQINSIALPDGMSSGFFLSGASQGVSSRFQGTASDFSSYLKAAGYDADFEETQIGSFDNVMVDRGVDVWASTLASNGISVGTVPDCTFRRAFISNPSLGFYSYALADSHRPLYREIQLEAQRLEQYGNFIGFSIGADAAGYVPYWDWAPPIPNRPWAEALSNATDEESPTVPVGGGNRPVKDYEMIGTSAQFVNYLAQYDRSYGQYGYFASAASDVNPRLVATTGSFGSAPGVFGRGGWPAGSIPGELMFRGMPLQQAYDWNEQSSTLPMHLEALLDRLRSSQPNKPTWAIVDDFGLHLNRETRQRAYALALTRGVTGIGTNFLPSPTGTFARPEVIAEQTELYSWIHRYGGIYASTKPQSLIGVLFVQAQALMRPTLASPTATQDELTLGSHEGKVTEALFLCHEAGFSARVITPEELRRGLPPTMKAVLLVGLNNFDSTWHWYDGLAPDLKKCVSNGVRVVRDNESVCPASVPSVATGMMIDSYVVNRDADWTTELLARNQHNCLLLKAAMNGVKPSVLSTSGSVWCIPTVTGNTEYVTVVNMATVDQPSAQSTWVIGSTIPQRAQLTWRDRSRPIYDVRLGAKLTWTAAGSCDLTRDAFQVYALPLASIVSPPKCRLTVGANGYYRVTVDIVSKGTSLTGVPISITVKTAQNLCTVYGCSGRSVELPLSTGDQQGAYVYTASELLTGMTSAPQTVVVQQQTSAAAIAARPNDRQLTGFFARKNVPLVIALTQEEMNDPAASAVANRLVYLAAQRGRAATIELLGLGSVIVGLQSAQSTMRYPAWRTIDADLILFGEPHNNTLIADENRALILPTVIGAGTNPAIGIDYVYSPFVGERDAINILGPDMKTIDSEVTAMFRSTKSQTFK